MKSSSVLPCWASTGRTVLEHQEGELEELGEQLDDEDGGLNLGVDALHHRAPAADLLLLIFSANSCAPCPPAHLPQQPAREQLSVRE